MFFELCVSGAIPYYRPLFILATLILIDLFIVNIGDLLCIVI